MKRLNSPPPMVSALSGADNLQTYLWQHYSSNKELGIHLDIHSFLSNDEEPHHKGPLDDQMPFSLEYDRLLEIQLMFLHSRRILGCHQNNELTSQLSDGVCWLFV